MLAACIVQNARRLLTGTCLILFRQCFQAADIMFRVHACRNMIICFPVLFVAIAGAL